MDTAIHRSAQDKVRAGLSGLGLMADSAEALAARILSARSARQSLDLMYYLWHDDRTGRLLLSEVVKAADRGVRVRLLVDDINPQRSDATYLALDSHPNIDLRLFNPAGMRNGSLLRSFELALRLFALTRRMHNKAWIADGRVAIVGGRNIGDAYFDAADTNFRDLDLLLLGPAVSQSGYVFERFWNSKATRPIAALHRVGAGDPDRDLRRLRALTDPELCACLGGRRTIDEMLAASIDLHWTSTARVIADPPEKALGRKRRGWLSKVLLPVIREASTRVDIASPYFIPGRRGSEILASLVRRGVRVSVLTNSLAATDVAAVHGAYANYRERLVAAGVRLYELRPSAGRANMSVFGSKGASLHTKAFTVDDRFGFVGSFNFDPRSVSLNAEMGVLFEDPTLASALTAEFRRERSPHASYRLGLDGTRLTWDCDEEGAPRRYANEPEAGWLRRAIAAVVGWLPVESQL
ncbi:MAG: phospholipase D family protein [Rhizobiaceae bacterium]